MPVDFHAVLGATSDCTTWPRLSPFFNYLNTNHAEGPKKWYIAACPGDVVKVYLPAKGIVYAPRAGEGVREGHFNGEKVLIDVQLWFDVSPRIKAFYMHLAVRDEITDVIQRSPEGYAIFDAGTHIGYLYAPPNSVYSLDFGVQDLDKDSGLTRFSEHWWNTRANPLDYFTEEIRGAILEAYQATYDSLAEEGVTPYSDIEDSRSNFDEQDRIWGIWVKDDIEEEGDGSAWSVVNLVKKGNLHQETYWKTLQAFPSMSGLFVEESRGEVVGKALYEGQPMGVNKFYILSGNDEAGVARIEEDWGSNPRTVYLRYQVQPNTDSKFDDKLIMESYSTLEAAMASQFSSDAVLFRRGPCKIGNPKC